MFQDKSDGVHFRVFNLDTNRPFYLTGEPQR